LHISSCSMEFCFFWFQSPPKCLLRLLPSSGNNIGVASVVPTAILTVRNDLAVHSEYDVTGLNIIF
jgi:hypothetical protein